MLHWAPNERGESFSGTVDVFGKVLGTIELIRRDGEGEKKCEMGVRKSEEFTTAECKHNGG